MHSISTRATTLGRRRNLAIVVAAAGLTSLYFFRDFNYDMSSLLDIVAYASIVAGIYFMTRNRRKILSH